MQNQNNINAILLKSKSIIKSTYSEKCKLMMKETMHVPESHRNAHTVLVGVLTFSRQ
jgi:hypothetical protein